MLPGVASRRIKRRDFTLWLVAIGLIFLIGGVSMAIAFAVTTAGAVAGTIRAYNDANENLPNAAQVVANTFQTTRIYDRNGVLLSEVTDPDTGWRTFVPYEDISPDLVNATVSAEDSTFWSHYGVEPIAILRGALIIGSGDGSSGGSTITQQLARALYPEKVNPLDFSISRKIREAFIAVALDKQYSKQDIITMYLNLIFYGQRSFGIEAAANTYFNKSAKDLNLAESSFLAGIPQAPSYFDPTVNFDQTKKRQQYVLNQMVKYDYITQEQADEAFKVPLSIQKRESVAYQAPHFTGYVQQWIIDHYGEDALYKSGLNFYTSIDTNLQKRAEEIVANGVANIAAYNRNNGAAVGIRPWSGEVLFMVGSANYNDAGIGGQVNYANALLQPGSSIKPFVYTAAFESGWNPGTIVFDTYLEVPNPGQAPYIPNNYSMQFNGAVPVRKALAGSLNIPAVKAMRYAGIQHVIDVTRRAGYVDSLPESADFYGLPLALGAGEVKLVEHTNAFATLANLGTFVPVHPVIKVTDAAGNVFYDLMKDPTVTHPQQAIEPEYAYQIASILTDNDARSYIFGPDNLFGNTQSELGRPTAAKSGTTEGWKDLWTMGFTTDFALGVWTGNTNAYGGAVGDLPQKDGIEMAGPIWHDLMVELHTDTWAKLLTGRDGKTIGKNFPVPADIYQGQVCVATGNRAEGAYENRTEVLVRNEGPALPCDQISAYQQQELEDALKTLDEKGDLYYGSAFDTIYRFRDVALYGEDPGGSDDSGSDSSDDSGSSDDNSGEGDSPPIVER
jgi:membrane peptidoglycan carboxypeptidase